MSAGFPSPETMPLIPLLPLMKGAAGGSGGSSSWSAGRYTFRWERTGGVGRLIITGIPRRPLPFTMVLDSETKARLFTPRLVTMLDAGRLPVEGVYRRLEGAGEHSGAMVAMAKGEDGDASTAMEFGGIPLRIEFPAGSVREGENDDGSTWQRPMTAHYGEVDRDFDGMDGERVDVYVGPDESSPWVYVVDQAIPGVTGFDEQKFMLGFSSLKQAQAAYEAHTLPGMLRQISIWSLPEFKDWLSDDDNSGEMADAPAVYTVSSVQHGDGAVSLLAKATMTTATAAPITRESVGNPDAVVVRAHTSEHPVGGSPRHFEVRFRPKSQRRRPTITPSARMLEDGETPPAGYLAKAGWAYKESRLAKAMSRGLSEGEAMERMKARWSKRASRAVLERMGSEDEAPKGQISIPLRRE